MLGFSPLASAPLASAGVPVAGGSASGSLPSIVATAASAAATGGASVSAGLAVGASTALLAVATGDSIVLSPLPSVSVAAPQGSASGDASAIGEPLTPCMPTPAEADALGAGVAEGTIGVIVVSAALGRARANPIERTLVVAAERRILFVQP